MKVSLASPLGLCPGVRDAIRIASRFARARPVTLLGPLAHNDTVRARLRRHGVLETDPERVGTAPTRDVIVTAHGASDRVKAAWREAGHSVTDATCPLVRRAHARLRALVAQGCRPVVIGRRDHAEVKGLLGDFPDGAAVLTSGEAAALPEAPLYGVIAQTTQPIDRVRTLVDEIRRAHPRSEVRFVDTVCRFTRERLGAVAALCRTVDAVVVVGGRASNNTSELAREAERCGARVFRAERASDLQPGWFEGCARIGVTAGTSTPAAVIREVVRRLGRLQTPVRSGHG